METSWGYQIDYVVEQLLFFNTEYTEDSSSTHKYFMYGPNDLVPIKRVFYNPKPLAKVILNQLTFPETIELPFPCSSIKVRNNIRIFGYGSNKKVSIKVALKGMNRHGDYRRGCLFREIKARKILTKQLSKTIPKLIDYDHKKGRWIEEELILESYNFSAEDKLKEFLDSKAFLIYNVTTRPQPLWKFIDKDVIKKYLPINLFKDQIFNPDCTVPIALCHGDLAESNLLKSKKGHLYVIDWEKAHVKPVAYDLLTTFKRHPKLRKSILALLGKLSSNSAENVEPRFQIAVAIANETAELEEQKTKIAKFFHQSQNKNTEKIIKELNSKIASVKQLIYELGL